MLCNSILPLVGLSVLAHAAPGMRIRDADRGKPLQENLRHGNGTGLGVKSLAQRDEWGLEDLGLDDSGFQDDGRLISIDTYVTVIATGHDVAHGYVDREKIDKQMDILDKAFNPADIFFKRMEPRWYNEPPWWNSEDRNPDQKKRLIRAMLRQGDYSSLNLFYMAELGTAGLVVGESSPPKQLVQDDDAYYVDGCMMASDKAPSEEDPTGHTTLQEVGEWLGIGLDREDCDTDGEELCPDGNPWRDYVFLWESERGGDLNPVQLWEARASWFKYRARPIPIVNGKRKMLSKITWEHKRRN